MTEEGNKEEAMTTPHTVFKNRRTTIARTLIVSLIAIGLASIGIRPGGTSAGSMGTEAAPALQTTVPMLQGTFQVVNNGPGDQTDPHLDCDRVSYTNDNFFGLLSIHYFDFATNADHAIPGNGNQYDIYIYDLSTAHLYRATNTPVNETLNDISVCNGIARVVYAAPTSDYDVYAFTFTVPNVAEDQINDLVELVESFDLPMGIENSLITKLQNALAAIEASDTATACECLTAFINECEAQSAKKLTADQFTQLINSANQIRTDLGCQ
jgi:hypothetical protein